MAGKTEDEMVTMSFPVERSAILPMKEVNLERVYTYWLWYLAPFKQPKVSQPCAAWVESGMASDPGSTQKAAWFRQLARAQTVKATAAAALTRKPGSLAGDREQYRRKGFAICQRAEGEVGNGEWPFSAWRPTMESGAGWIGCRQIVEELKLRLPWAVAQLTARVAETERRMEMRGITASQLDYAETSLGLLVEALNGLKGNGQTVEEWAAHCVPLPEELLAFFLQFDSLVLQAKQDVRMKQQQDLAANITGLNTEIASLLTSAREQLEGSPA